MISDTRYDDSLVAEFGRTLEEQIQDDVAWQYLIDEEQYQDTVIERTDYWYQDGSLYTACKDCDEVLCKNPDYDVFEAVETGEFAELTGDSYDSL